MPLRGGARLTGDGVDDRTEFVSDTIYTARRHPAAGPLDLTGRGRLVVDLSRLQQADEGRVSARIGVGDRL